MRFLFYSHDGLGLGHTRRHLAIAGALTRRAPEASVLLASGADDALRMGLPRQVEILKLPGLRKVSNDSYYPRRLRIPAPEIRAMRAALLLTTVKSYRPNVVLVDKHPFGVNGEFRDALSAARKSGSRAVLGLRDVLDEPATVLREWAPHQLQAEISENFDLMFVYGEQSIFDPLSEYEFPNCMAERTKFCGYVVNHEAPETRSGFVNGLNLSEWSRPIVLATTGGGEDGFHLLETFIRTAAEAPWQGIVVTGPMTPPHQLKALRELAEAHDVPLEMFVPNLSATFSSVDALVCMGGYNTLAEAVSQGVPTVCVPRIAPRAEQVIRARALEQLGLVSILSPDAMDVATLGDAIGAVMKMRRDDLLSRAQANLKFDGAAQAASHLLALATQASVLAVAS